MTIITPTVGRVVWYRPGEYDAQTMAISSSDNPQPLCAHVAYVHSDRCVNLVVYDHNGQQFRRTSVLLVQEGDAIPGGIYAEWMPYQVGRAKKYEAPQQNGIGWAVKMMQDGHKVRRPGWNGKGMWLGYVDPSQWGLSSDAPVCHGDVANRLLPWIGIKTADGGFVPWLASQSDLLATDWEIAD